LGGGHGGEAEPFARTLGWGKGTLKTKLLSKKQSEAMSRAKKIDGGCYRVASRSNGFCGFKKVSAKKSAPKERDGDEKTKKARLQLSSKEGAVVR